MTPPSEAQQLAEAEQARRDGNPLRLYDLAHRAITDGATSPRFGYLMVLALAQMGDTEQALEAYDNLGLGRLSTDEDALALRGRLLKDLALAAAPDDQPALFRAASDAYGRAAALHGGYFPLINAATTARIGGEVASAATLARQVLAHPDLNPPNSFFAAASRAEAHVLLGEAEAAVADIRETLQTNAVGYGERASTCRQLDWLSSAVGLPETARTAILTALRPPPVLAYAGAMFPDNAPDEAAMARRVGEALDPLGTRIAFGGLACGAEILVAEQVLRTGGELHVVLPYRQQDYVEACVRIGGEAWLERFDACLAAAASVTLATRMEHVGDPGQMAYARLVAMGLCALRAVQIAAEPIQLLVGRVPTPDVEAGWAALGGRTMALPDDLDDLPPLAPAHPAAGAHAARVVRAIIFTDYKGYSKLQETEIPAFNREIMGRIATVLARYPEAICSRNTWGDAVHAVVADAASAADLALDILDSLRGVSVAGGGHDAEGMRIGLHYGPVYEEVDAVTGLTNYYGSEVTLTARIEPAAIPGEIYTTQAFAAILAVTAPERFASRYVGQVELAKGYGAQRIYKLERRRAPTRPA